MPAPKAVLRDIHDLGLNPKVAHKSIDSNGRIKQPVKAEPTLPKVKPTKEKQSKDKAPKASTEASVVTDVTVASDEATSKADVSSEGAGIVEHEKEVASPASDVKPATRSKPASS